MCVPASFLRASPKPKARSGRLLRRQRLILTATPEGYLVPLLGINSAQKEARDLRFFFNGGTVFAGSRRGGATYQDDIYVTVHVACKDVRV